MKTASTGPALSLGQQLICQKSPHLQHEGVGLYKSTPALTEHETVRQQDGVARRFEDMSRP